MQVYGPAQLHGAQPIRAPHSLRLHQPQPSTSSSVGDELTLSDTAQLVDRVRDLPDIRTERVAQIRAQIAAGTYENDAKLNGALEHLLDEIG